MLEAQVHELQGKTRVRRGSSRKMAALVSSERFYRDRVGGLFFLTLMKGCLIHSYKN